MKTGMKEPIRHLIINNESGINLDLEYDFDGPTLTVAIKNSLVHNHVLLDAKVTKSS